MNKRIGIQNHTRLGLHQIGALVPKLALLSVAILLVLSSTLVACTGEEEEEEEEGLPTFVAHFMTPEGEPFPFDVIISDGTYWKEFKNVTEIETEVPLDATYTFSYRWGGWESYRNFDMSFGAGEVREFEFYASGLCEPRVRPYLSYQEAGANASLSWQWDPDASKLTWTLSSESGKCVGLMFEIDDDASEPPNYGLLVYEPGGDGPIPMCNQAQNHWEDIPGVGIPCVQWPMHCADYWPTYDQYPLASSDITGHVVFDLIEPTLGTIRLGYGLYKDATAVYPIDTTLKNLNATIFERDFIDPQYAVPEGNYILTAGNIPQGYASLAYPINVEAGKGTSINKFYLPKISELSDFSFLVAAESAFSHSAYSGLTHDEANKTLAANVTTQTDYDWWGCFVLPKTATVTSVGAWYGMLGRTLNEGEDYTINPVDDYNLLGVVVRITPETQSLNLHYAKQAA